MAATTRSTTADLEFAVGDAYQTADGETLYVIDENAVEVLFRLPSGNTEWVVKTEIVAAIKQERLTAVTADDYLLRAPADELEGTTIQGRHLDGETVRGVIARVHDLESGRSLEVRTSQDWTTTIYPDLGVWEAVD